MNLSMLHEFYETNINTGHDKHKNDLSKSCSKSKDEGNEYMLT